MCHTPHEPRKVLEVTQYGYSFPNWSAYVTVMQETNSLGYGDLHPAKGDF